MAIRAGLLLAQARVTDPRAPNTSPGQLELGPGVGEHNVKCYHFTSGDEHLALEVVISEKQVQKDVICPLSHRKSKDQGAFAFQPKARSTLSYFLLSQR